MKITTILLMISFIVALSVTACTPRSCKVPPVNQLQACLELRRQIIFLGNNETTNYPFAFTAGQWRPPTRQALLLKKYRDFHCDDVLRECSPQGIYNSGGLRRPCP